MKTKTLQLIKTFVAPVGIAMAIVTSTHAVDYTWGGGTGNWNAANWNPGAGSGPTTAGNTATITNGNVTANVGGPGALDSITLGSGGQLNFYNGDGGIYAYQGVGNLILQGGTVNGGSATYNAYGCSILGNVTVSGSAPSTITGGSFFNINPTTTFTVADVTGDTNTDLTVSVALRGPTGSPDTTYNYGTLIKEGAGKMTITRETYAVNPTINAGSVELSGSSGGYGIFRIGNIQVNSGTTLSLTGGDGTGFGWQNGYKPISLTISNGTVNSLGTCHVWDISGGINMTGGSLIGNGGVSDPSGPQFEWNYVSVTTSASANTATIGGRIRIRADGGYTGIPFSVADGAAATDLLVSAAITEASGGLGISKSGAGTMVLSGTNNYTGTTTVTAGSLLVDGSLGSTPVTVSGGAVGGSGTVAGAVTATGTGKITPGTDGTAGTLTLNGGLTMGSGSTFGMDVSTTYNSGNDQAVVAGTLTLNNTAFNLKALSGASNLDTNSDYVLVTSGGISGSPSPAVIWVGRRTATTWCSALRLRPRRASPVQPRVRPPWCAVRARSSPWPRRPGAVP
jgi:autotransporter-associated beta strand protein